MAVSCSMDPQEMLDKINFGGLATPTQLLKDAFGKTAKFVFS